MKQPLPTKAFPVSWDAFHRDARALAWRLPDAGPFQAVVCITRGGLVPAAIVARELNLRIIETVCVTSYGEPGTQGKTAKRCIEKRRARRCPVAVLPRSPPRSEAGPRRLLPGAKRRPTPWDLPE